MPADSPDILRFNKTRRGEPLHPYTLVGVLLLCALVGMAGATQYVAFRFGFHPNLGPALYPPGTLPRAPCVLLGVVLAVGGTRAFRTPAARRGAPLLLLLSALACVLALGPLYPPTRVFEWGIAYSRVLSGEGWARVQPIFDGALPAGLAAFLASAAASLSLVLGGGVKHASNSHGTAEFGTGDELLLPRDEARRRHELLRAGRKVVEPGIMVGRHGNGGLLWYQGPSHVLTMAPTRSGKGVGAVVPALLRYPGSVVCMDIKGENFHVTHRQRIADGGEILVLDPFRVTGDHPYHAYANPLDTIDTRGPRSNRALDDCKTLAEMLVEEEDRGNRHFSDEGRSLLACFMLHVCHEFHSRPEQRTLMKVRELLTLSDEAFNEFLEEMAESDNPLVQRGIARLQQKEERERTGVISTAQRGIDFLDSISMANVLVPPAGSALEGAARPRQVDLSLIKGEIPMTIYLVIPPETLKTHAAWIRLMIACINNMITRIPGRPTHRVLMLLDEFAQLGHIRPVVEGISLVGGYGVLFWIIVQDLAQLKGLYKDNWETIFANCDVKQCFGTNDWSTADLLSKMAGETTLFTEGGSSGRGRSYGKSSGQSSNYGESVSEKGRRLLLPDEVMRLSPQKQLLFVKGSGVLLTGKISYLSDPEFTGLFDANPMYN